MPRHKRGISISIFVRTWNKLKTFWNREAHYVEKIISTLTANDNPRVYGREQHLYKRTHRCPARIVSTRRHGVWETLKRSNVLHCELKIEKNARIIVLYRKESFHILHKGAKSKNSLSWDALVSIVHIWICFADPQTLKTILFPTWCRTVCLTSKSFPSWALLRCLPSDE